MQTVTAQCGGTSKSLSVRVLGVDIEINNTQTTDDDVVQVQSTHPAQRFNVPCRIRLFGPAAAPLTVVLTNPDGRLRFPNAADATVTLALPVSGAFVPFNISGETASVAKGDAKIQAHLSTAGGPVVANAAVTVFTFDNAQMTLTQGGNYGFLADGVTFTVLGGVPAVSFSSKARLRPAGLSCAAPQIAKLRIAIMQEVSHHNIQMTWDTPTVAWDPATPSGTPLTVPTTMRETNVWTAAVHEPVNDGFAGATPLYSRAAGALQPPEGCAGAAAATDNDTPPHTVPTTFTQPQLSGATVIANVTWTHRVNTTRVADFRTFCVVFDTATNAFSSLREATWALNVNSAAATPQHVTVSADGAATADPATGIQANVAPTANTDAGVGAATTTFVKP
jgi:hypothetical protein